MGIGHLFRHKRLFFFTVMCCALVWIAMLSVGFSCCAVVNLDAGREGGMLMVQDPDPPFAPVKVAADFASDETSSQNIHGKKLLQDTSSWEEFKHNMELQLGSEHEQKMLSADKTLRYEELGELQNLADIPATEQAQVERNVNQDSTNSGTIQRTVAAGTKKIPQAIIIGVKKGGTRALLEFLRIHPDVRAPGPETHFFDRYYHKGLQWYRKQMPPTLDGQMTIEKTPSYFITKEVPRRIFSMSPNIKLIVVVRDPVTRAISDYTQAASKRPGMKPFEHMAFLDNYTGLVNTSWGAIRIGVYAKHLDKWLKYFPLSQMHFVSGEKLITDPAGEMGRVQDFLGLKRVISEKHFYFNETKGFPCLKKTEGSGRPHCLGKSKGRQHPKVGPRLLQRLRDFFRPFNAKFYQMVGQDFGWP